MAENQTLQELLDAGRQAYKAGANPVAESDAASGVLQELLEAGRQSYLSRKAQGTVYTKPGNLHGTADPASVADPSKLTVPTKKTSVAEDGLTPSVVRGFPSGGRPSVLSESGAADAAGRQAQMMGGRIPSASTAALGSFLGTPKGQLAQLTSYWDQQVADAWKKYDEAGAAVEAAEQLSPEEVKARKAEYDRLYAETQTVGDRTLAEFQALQSSPEYQAKLARMEELSGWHEELVSNREKAKQAAVQMEDERTYALNLYAINALDPQTRSAVERYRNLMNTGDESRSQEYQEEYEWCMEQFRKAGLTDEQINAYWRTYDRYRNQENAASTAAAAREFTTAIPGLTHTAANIGSVGMNLIGGITGTAQAIQQALDFGNPYKNADPNAVGFLPSVWSDAVRGQTTEDIAGDGTSGLRNAANLVYSGTMSAADNLARLGIGILTGTPGVTLALAGTSTFQNTYRSATNAGASTGQALLMGVVDAGIEVLTEKMNIDSIFSKFGPNASPATLTGFLKTYASELTEEEISFFGSMLAESFILREKSNFNQAVAQLVAEGMDETQAQNEVWRDIMLQACLELPVSVGISSGIMTGSSALFQRAQARAATNQNTGKVDPSSALEIPKLTDADILDATVAGENVGAADTAEAAVQEAVESFRNTGKVSNNLATRILQTPGAVEYLQQNAALTLPGTAAGNRDAVKTAVGTLSANQQVSHSPVVENNEVADISSGNQQKPVKYKLLEYSQHQKDNWAGSKRIVLFEGIEQFKNFIRNALSGTSNSNKKMYFGAISRELANEIQRSTGIDVEGYNLSLAESEIRKINKDHGDAGREAPRGQRAVTEDDFLNIPNVVQSPDEISLSPNAYEGKPVILFRKANGNETTVVVAVVSDKRLDLFVQTSYINKKGSIATPEPVQAGSFTPKATGGTAPMSIIHSGEQYVNHSQGDSSDSSGTVAVGAASVNEFSDYDRHLAQSEHLLEQGEDTSTHPRVREVSVPKFDPQGRPISQTVQTVMEAEVTPEDFVPLMEQETVGGKLSYIKISNSQAVQSAQQKIMAMGWQDAYQDWVSKVRSGKVSAELSARGALLLNNAAQKGEERLWLDILSEYRAMGTRAAQATQAMRILKSLEPSDRLYMIRKSLNYLMASSGLPKMEIPADLAQAYEQAKTDEEADTVLEEIQQYVADQIAPGNKGVGELMRDLWSPDEDVRGRAKVDLMRKWNSLRYLQMLGNFRTQGRNIAGNAFMSALNFSKNNIATLMEYAASKVSGGQFERTKSFTVSRELLKLCKADFERKKNDIQNGGKNTEDGGPAVDFIPGVRQKERIFKNKALEGYRKLTSKAMDAEDIWFSRPAYARALAGYLKAHGYEYEQLGPVEQGAEGYEAGGLAAVPPEVLEEARNYAIQEAQEVTFRDNNALSTWLTEITNRPGAPWWEKVVIKGIQPFAKTPANVMIRAVEYSPAGLIKAAFVDASRAAKGDPRVSGAQAVESLAKGLSGTALFALGMALANAGFLRAGAPDDEDKSTLDELAGHQEYSVEIGGISFTIDWMSPVAVPLLMGAELMEQIHENGFTLESLSNTLTSVTDVMVQMSMLQGLNSTFEAVKYSDNPAAQWAINACVNYLMQGLTNSTFGQVERGLEGKRMTTYVDPDSPLPDWMQKALGKASAKMPGLDFQQIPYINAWGEEESYNRVAGLAENMLSPSYLEALEEDEVSAELKRLASAQPESVAPSVNRQKSISYKKAGAKESVKYNLSAQEYVAMQKAQGTQQRKLVEKLIQSDAYKALPDEVKAQAVGAVYDYARELARAEVLPDYGDPHYSWMVGIQGDPVTAIVDHVTKSSTGLSDTRYAAAEALGISREKMEEMNKQYTYLTSGLEFEVKDPETGEKYGDVRDIQKMEAIVDSMSGKDEDLYLRTFMTEKQVENYDAVLSMRDNKGASLTAEDYVAAYRASLDGDSKQSIIRTYMKDLGVTKATAEALYDLFN